MQISPVAQNKTMYFLKKRAHPINSENYREQLLFGLLSPSPLLQLSSTVEQVIVVPLLPHWHYIFLWFLWLIYICLLLFLSCLHIVLVCKLTVSCKVCVPLLSNNKNHEMWPNLMSEDVARHVESMCSITSVVQGQVLGKTVLPMPSATDRMETSHSIFNM